MAETVYLTLPGQLYNVFDRVFTVKTPGDSGFHLWAAVFECPMDSSTLSDRINLVTRGCQMVLYQLQSLSDLVGARQIWVDAVKRLSFMANLSSMHQTVANVRGRAHPSDAAHLVTLAAHYQLIGLGSRVDKSSLDALADSVETLIAQIKSANIGAAAKGYILYYVERLLVTIRHINLYGVDSVWEANGELASALVRYNAGAGAAEGTDEGVSHAIKEVVVKCYGFLIVAGVVSEGGRAIIDAGRVLLSAFVPEAQ